MCYIFIYHFTDFIFYTLFLKRMRKCAFTTLFLQMSIKEYKRYSYCTNKNFPNHKILKYRLNWLLQTLPLPNFHVFFISVVKALNLIKISLKILSLLVFFIGKIINLRRWNALTWKFLQISNNIKDICICFHKFYEWKCN